MSVALGMPQYSASTSIIAQSAMSNYMGWPTNIDSAFLPESAEDIEAWQTVLRSRPTWPDNLLNRVSPHLSSDAIDVAGGALTTHSGSRSDRFTLIASNGGAHGFMACLRAKLLAACDGLPSHLCSDKADALPGTSGSLFGVTADGMAPTEHADGKNKTCAGEIEYYELWASATFCLMPGGDGFDRGATVQALDVAVASRSSSLAPAARGDLLRNAFSRSYFGTDNADMWSVLLDGAALIGCSGSADDSSCHTGCVGDKAMPSRLLESLVYELHRVPAMRTHIINTLAMRTQARWPLRSPVPLRKISSADLSLPLSPPCRVHQQGRVTSRGSPTRGPCPPSLNLPSDRRARRRAICGRTARDAC